MKLSFLCVSEMRLNNKGNISYKNETLQILEREEMENINKFSHWPALAWLHFPFKHCLSLFLSSNLYAIGLFFIIRNSFCYLYSSILYNYYSDFILWISDA